MSKFYFEAANQEGNKVSGHLVAENLAQARSLLQQQKFAIFSIVTSEQKKIETQKKTEEGVISFEFEGLDKKKSPVHGHISASDIGSAYKTLQLDYSYTIKYLVEDSLSETEKLAQKKEGISKELLEWFEIEAIKEKKQNTETRILKKEERKEVKLSPQEKAQIEKLQQEVTNIVQESFDLLEKNSEYLDLSKKREITDRLNLLSRLKRSNAIDHLKNLTTRVLEEIQNDTIFLKTINSDSLLEKKEEFKLFSDQHGSGLKKRILELPVDIDFESIDIIKVKLRRAEILKNIVKSVYEFFIIETVLLVVFFAVNIFLSGIINNPKPLIYLKSENMWWLFYIGFLIVLIFLPLYKKNTYKFYQKAVYFVSGFALFLFALLQFHGVFFWTT